MALRRTLVNSCLPLKIEKKSYLKPGSRAFKSGEEDVLFKNMFEFKLNDHYEDNY